MLMVLPLAFLLVACERSKQPKIVAVAPGSTLLIVKPAQEPRREAKFVEASEAGDSAGPVVTDANLRQLARGLRAGITSLDVGRLMRKVNSKAPWTGDHSENGAVLRQQAGDLALVLIFNRSAESSESRLVTWDLKEQQAK
jgi:hypothetical protein